MEAIPLSAEDRAILDLESPTVAGHTCKVVVLESTPGLDELRERVAAGLARAPRLTRCLGEADGAAAWVPDPGFSVANHVVAAEAPIPSADLPGAVAHLFEGRLSRDRPLWRIDRQPLADGGCALIWRLHHSLADGTTAMAAAAHLLWDQAENVPSPPPAGERRGRSAAPPALPTPGVPPDDDERRRGHLGAFIQREFGEMLSGSPFDGEIGSRRSVAFAAFSLGKLHDAAHAVCGATLNDAVLAVVAGGLRRWVEAHHGLPGTLRFKVPVSLHREGEDAANHDSFFTLPVALGEPDPAARLRSIHELSAERKAAHDAERLDELLSGLGEQDPRLAELVERLSTGARGFALSVSNIRGPREPVSVLGAAVTALHTLGEIGRRHALRVAVISYAGRLDFGLCADPAIAPDVAAMAAGIEAEAEALVAAAADL